MANVTFTYVSDSATNVAVAGTFNGWSTTANPLAHTGNVFTATIPLQNGSYQ